MFRAYVLCLEEGKPPTYGNLAKAVGVSRQAMWEVCLRHPDLMAWIQRQVELVNVHFLSSVIRRHSLLAIQGSIQSAELILKWHAGGFTRPERGDLDPAPGVGASVTLNLLVPRPELPALPAAAPALAAAPLADIPVVK